MAYQELFQEHNELLNEKLICQNDLSALPDGCITKKKISGKEYCYLQRKTRGKTISKIIKKNELSNIQAQLSKRYELSNRLMNIDKRIDTLEKASLLIDSTLHKKMLMMRYCYILDTFSTEKRKKTIIFSKAMASIEGLSVSGDYDNTINEWVLGKASIRDCCLRIMRKNNLI